jgi:hypothetical protein
MEGKHKRPGASDPIVGTPRAQSCRTGFFFRPSAEATSLYNWCGGYWSIGRSLGVVREAYSIPSAGQGKSDL